MKENFIDASCYFGQLFDVGDKILEIKRPFKILLSNDFRRPFHLFPADMGE